MNTDAVLKAADHAAAMSDRWMFVATLLVFGLCAVAVARYFVRQHERLIADHKEARDTYQSSLRAIVAEQMEGSARLRVCLDNNSRVLEECRDAMRYCERKNGGV